MNISFEGKCILVTGSGQGIGRAVTKALVSCKAEKVFALSKTPANLQSLLEEEPSIIPVCVDLSNWDETKRKLEELGRIDGLVNSAGIAITEPFLKIKPDSFDKIFAVNVKALVNVSQIVAQQMILHKHGGSIVNISSQASKVALRDHTLYGATKRAIDSMTESMALELGQYNIRVNAINPTVVMTSMGRENWSDPEKAGPLLKRIPLGRFAEVDEVVNVILFLLSDKASMVNATTLPVDGGFITSS